MCDRAITSRRWVLLALAALSLIGCVSLSPSQERIPVVEVATTEPSSQRLVIVLPGFGDDLERLESSNIANHLQAALPGTDVVLAEATIAYYMDGQLVRRLHEQLVVPAQKKYREVWMAGASMGGVGVTMYEHDHPGVLSGLVLMAPSMGSRGLQREIIEAGGLAAWDPGPVPAEITRRNVGREQWRVVQTWLRTPARAESVWLVCGDEDRLRSAADIIATVLPANHALRVSGGHRWDVWAPAVEKILSR